MIPSSPAPAAGRRPRVIVGLPHWAVSGPCVFAERLVRGLGARGWDASVLVTEAGTTRIPPPSAPAAPPADIPCLHLPVHPDDPWGVRWDAMVRVLESAAPCHYLMLHDWRNNVVASRLSDRVRLVGLLQADNELDFEQAGRLGRFWNAVVAVSDPLLFSFAYRFPHLAHRALLIRNTVPDLPAIPAKPPAPPLRIASSGELRRTQKRLDDQIAVARLLAETGVPFELTIYGDGEYRQALELQAAGLVSAGLVRFAGRLPASRMPDEMADKHCFLLTSSFEGLSIALLEAMSRGCVPVVSDLVTQSLLVRDGLNGLTAPVGDIDAFAGHLARLAGDGALRGRLSQAAFDSIRSGGHRIDDMLDSWEALFARIDDQLASGAFSRPLDRLQLPPERLGSTDILPALPGDRFERLIPDLDFIHAAPVWPASPPLRPRKPASASVTPTPALEEHKVIVSSIPGSISGVDVFAAHLVRGLRERGIDARLHGRRLGNEAAVAGLPHDVPFLERDPALDDEKLGWLNRWKLMVDHLERLAPCIYVPNYDVDFSCVAPQLSDRVRVVGIGHSDDPWHYEHLCRIGHACDAIVGVSHAITDHLRGLASEFTPRLETIPYGIPLSPPAANAGTGRLPDPGADLRIIYSGRLVQPQKRALDLVAITRALDARGVPYELAIVGDGDIRGVLEREVRDLVRSRRLWFTGMQPNSGVLELLEKADAFLLPSAFEGLSVGMLEAMARGVVPVVSDIRSGVPDVIVPGENGLVAPVGDIGRFADHLEWLWRNPEKRARMAAAAATTVAAGYTVETMIDRYVDLFRRIVAEPFARPAGPFVPVAHLRRELTWSLWASRIAADPAASVRRVTRRIQQAWR